MRLPQSIAWPPRLCLSSAALVVALLAIGPLSRPAAAQQLVFSPIILKFGTVLVGQSEPHVVIVTNAGTASTEISSITASASEFSISGVTLPVVLAPGNRVAITVTFTPARAGWTGVNEITFVENSPQSTAQLEAIGIGVTAEPLVASPTSIAFGDVPVGSTATQSVVLKNSSSVSAKILGIGDLGIGFSVQGGPASALTLAPGQSTTFQVVFSPKFRGVNGASIYVYGPSVDIPVTGTGTKIGQLAISPSALNFGSVDLGATGKQTLSMTATSGTVIVSSAASSNSQFTIQGTSFPLTIDPGQSASLNVVFSPTQSGTSSGKLTFAANSTNTPGAESLSGTGVQPQYSVALSWNASTSPVSGYNVYRGAAVGSYSRINPTLNSSTTYTDSTVASGTTYYYAATAVSPSGQESTYSEPLKVVIP
jgi:Abnormal spindle-like microcephaly-assoc'd, ASPM-SPD-2-Hydin